jgi:hypothetical protein
MIEFTARNICSYFLALPTDILRISLSNAWKEFSFDCSIDDIQIVANKRRLPDAQPLLLILQGGLWLLPMVLPQPLTFGHGRPSDVMRGGNDAIIYAERVDGSTTDIRGSRASMNLPHSCDGALHLDTKQST